MQRFFKWLLDYIGPAKDSAPDSLHPGEIARIHIPSLLSGTAIAVLILILQAMSLVAPNILGPIVGGLATWILASLCETFRRLGQYDPRIFEGAEGKIQLESEKAIWATQIRNPDGSIAVKVREQDESKS